MPYIWQPKILGNGQLPNSKGTLYTVPASCAGARVSLVTSYNTNTTAETVNYYVKVSGGTSRQFERASLATLTSLFTIGGLSDNTGTLMLSPGDIVEGDTTTASKVDYAIHGEELAWR